MYNDRIRPLRVAAVVAATAISALALSGPGHAADRTKTLRFFSKQVSVKVTKPDGRVIDRPPYPQMKPGDVLDVLALDYPGDHLQHAARFTMSEHVHCVFGQGEPDCISNVAAGNSLLIWRGNPGRLFDATGRYAGATGRVLSMREVDGGSDVVARITLR
jgi:hypothetical protein